MATVFVTVSVTKAVTVAAMIGVFFYATINKKPRVRVSGGLVREEVWMHKKATLSAYSRGRPFYKSTKTQTVKS